MSWEGMQKPIYTLRNTPFFPKDKIRPYGDRIYPSSEKLRKELALQLLAVTELSEEELEEFDEELSEEKAPQKTKKS